MNNNLIPYNWTRVESVSEVKYLAPNVREAKLWDLGAAKHLKKEASALNKKVVVLYNQNVVFNEYDPIDNKRIEKGSYGATSVNINSSMEEIFDFILDKANQGLSPRIVDMATDNYLFMRNWVSLDGEDCLRDNDWVGVDAKHSWRDSFLLGNRNYYGILIDNLKKDGHIPNYYYKIRQNSGLLSACQTDYYLVNWNGSLCRLSIQDPRNRKLLEYA